MPFALKTMPNMVLEVLPQHQKLNRLIDEIEQQKQLLLAWQHAQDDIRAYSQKALMPAYRELYSTLYEQMKTLWNGLSSYSFTKSNTALVEDKIQTLARLLQDSHLLSQKQLDEVEKMYAYYQQADEYSKKKNKKKNIDTFDEPVTETVQADDVFEDWNNDQYQQAREQAKLKRQQDKQAKASMLVNQSLKTVYLKIASIIHPDREPDEVKKLDKTELLQKVNEAYAEQDLFYLLKLQLQLETNKGLSSKALSSEQVKFYQLSLEAQSQNLQSQLEEILASFHLSSHINTKQLKMSDVYKVIDKDAAELKQQLKWEKERLKHMKKVSGVEMLLGHGVL